MSGAPPSHEPLLAFDQVTYSYPNGQLHLSWNISHFRLKLERSSPLSALPGAENPLFCTRLPDSSGPLVDPFGSETL